MFRRCSKRDKFSCKRRALVVELSCRKICSNWKLVVLFRTCELILNPKNLHANGSHGYPSPKLQRTWAFHKKRVMSEPCIVSTAKSKSNRKLGVKYETFFHFFIFF